MASPINYKKSVNSTCLQLKEEEALFVMHKFETFDCGLIKGQPFSEFECDLTFIFLNMYISREIHSHQNYQTLLFCSRTIF